MVVKSKDDNELFHLASNVLYKFFLEAQTMPRRDARGRILGGKEKISTFSAFDIEFMGKSVQYIKEKRFIAVIYDLLGMDDSAVDAYLAMRFEPWRWESDEIREDWCALVELLKLEKFNALRAAFLTIVNDSIPVLSKSSVYAINSVSNLVMSLPYKHEEVEKYAHMLWMVMNQRSQFGQTEDDVLLLVNIKEFSKKFNCIELARFCEIKEFSSRYYLATKIIESSPRIFWGQAIGHLEVCNRLIGTLIKEGVNDEKIAVDLKKKFYWQFAHCRDLAIRARLHKVSVSINVDTKRWQGMAEGIESQSTDELFARLLNISLIQESDVVVSREDVARQLLCSFLDVAIVEGSKIAGEFKSNDLNSRNRLVEKYIVVPIAKHISRTVIKPCVEKLHNESEYLKRRFYKCLEADAWCKNSKKQIVCGIIAGLNEDFYTANMVLLPQLEAFVRFKLECCNESTRHISGGIEKDLVLSTLITKPKFDECFDASIRDNIRWMYGSNPSLNLRNILCHGLCDDEDVDSANDVLCYSWWLLMKIFWEYAG